MTGFEHIGKPLAASREEAARYLKTEMDQALPEGWALSPVEGDPLAWIIAKVDDDEGGSPIKEYSVRVSNGLDMVVFTYGNNDIGPLSLHQVLLKSLVIDAGFLRHFGMAACLQHLITQCEPNQWGYT